MCDHDIEARRVRDLERYHRRTAERRAQDLCLKCGKRPPAPHRSQCEPCTEKQRVRDLARYHRRTAERIARGLCPKCGLCGIPHKPHDVHFMVMLNIVEVSLCSKGLAANHFT